MKIRWPHARQLLVPVAAAMMAGAAAPRPVVAQTAVAQAASPQATCSYQRSWKGDVIPAADRNYARTQTTANGKYRVSVREPGDTVPMQRLHSWVLHIEDTTGVAVDSAALCVDGGMPEHGHGLPTRPAVSDPPHDGDYQIDGMKFSMSGWWVVKFVISGRNGVDSVRFNLALP